MLFVTPITQDIVVASALIGIADSGRVQGSTSGKESLNEWLLHIKAEIRPSRIPDLQAHQIDGKSVDADVQADNYRSSLRNKRVAEGFCQVNAIEKYGSVFIRIRKAMLEYPEVEFTAEGKFGGVVASFTQLENQTTT